MIEGVLLANLALERQESLGPNMPVVAVDEMLHHRIRCLDLGKQC
jgi:hypothetical protein